MNILKTNDLCRLMHRDLGKPYVYFIEDGKTYSYNVNRFGAYAAKNGLLMKSKKLLIIADEDEKPTLAVKIYFYKKPKNPQ
ncbi:gp117 [Erwinia phage vB_Eam-MM7]|uniref:Gp117 n=1 Tax=Erwinia phage vB_Eam-MM7 TaxID=1051674 RepID=G0YPU9_9CAUD|nr:gp117 [Erwinia phage vB_Eam-MM7]AEJ81376.1 gp117 [Erwinia phage vB_Eam-MM7]UNA00976.1 hypothetical protein 1Hena2_00140 [Erwinia phage Hena2]WNA13733.1 hypothetical protein FIfi106_00112 [Erwinia phage FIfi106]